MWKAKDVIREIRLPDGGLWLEIAADGGGYGLRFPGLAEFRVSGDGVVLEERAEAGVSWATLEHLRLNQVRPLAMSLQRRLVFHGSAVEVEGVAAGFLGESGRGKSTLAGSFAVEGVRFLTDDGLVLEERGGEYWAEPSHASIRLWGDSQAELVGAEAELAPAVEYTDKARILADERLAFCGEARRLGALYFLGDGTARTVEVRAMTGSEATMELVRHSFLMDLGDEALLRWHFGAVVGVAAGVRCRRLDYPRRYGMLGWVRAAVAADLRAIGEGR